MARTFARIIDGQLDAAVTVRQSRRAESAADIIDSVALSDGRRMRERPPSRRYILLLGTLYPPLRRAERAVMFSNQLLGAQRDYPPRCRQLTSHVRCGDGWY